MIGERGSDRGFLHTSGFGFSCPNGPTNDWQYHDPLNHGYGEWSSAEGVKINCECKVVYICVSFLLILHSIRRYLI